jgi:hypothetical protein
MAQTKATPGPWNVFKENSFRETGEISPEIWNKHGRIATVSIISKSTDKEEVLTNARLIAQSPNGYALAQAVVEADAMPPQASWNKLLTLARQFLTAVDGEE